MKKSSGNKNLKSSVKTTTSKTAKTNSKVKTKKKNNQKMALIVGIIAVALIAIGGGYLLSEGDEFGGGFNATINSTLKYSSFDSDRDSQLTLDNEKYKYTLKVDRNVYKLKKASGKFNRTRNGEVYELDNGVTVENYGKYVAVNLTNTGSSKYQLILFNQTEAKNVRKKISDSMIKDFSMGLAYSRVNGKTDSAKVSKMAQAYKDEVKSFKIDNLNYCYRKVTNASGTTLSYGTGVCPITYKLYLKNYSQSACKKGNAPYDKWLVQYATCKSSHIEVTANVEVDIAHSSYGTGAWTPVKSSGSSGPEVSNNGQCYCCGNSQGCTYKWSENGSSPGSNCGKVSKTKDQCTGTATNAITCNVSNCSKCSSNNYCSICKGDYTPSNGACVCKNIEGCIKYNSSCKCAKCDESEYTLSNGTCKAKSSGGSSGSTQEGTCECYKYEAVCTRVYVVNKCSNCNGTCTYDYELAHYECSETKKHYGLKDNTTCSKLEGINWGGTVKEVKQSYKCGNLTTCTKVCNSHGMYVKSGKCGSGGNGGR